MRRFALTLVTLATLTLPAAAQDYRVEILAEGLDRPWGMAFLPSGDLVITGRSGRLMLWDGAAVHPVAGAPAVVARGQGGLLDIAAAPDFARSATVWLSWVAPVQGGTSTHLGRARLDTATRSLTELETVFVVSPGVDSGAHFGGRILIHDGHVFLGLGDRGAKDFGPDHLAQDLSTENGTVVRLRLDGTIPPDNPLVGQPGAQPAIYSYGHRNVQAITAHPQTGAIWAAEHGEAGGDEINILRAGANYGWPLASHGVSYMLGRTFAPPHQPGDGFEAPVYHWGPGRSDNFPPSGMVFYNGDAFPDWRGDLLIGNLAHQYLGRFSVDGRSVSLSERLLAGQGWRIRDVAVGPDDGFVYVLVDGANAPLVRLVPAN